MPIPNPAAKSSIGGTNLVSGALAPVSIQGISPKAFGASDVNLGGALEALATGFDRAARQQEAVERSAAYSDMDALQTNLYTRMDDLYRQTKPGTDNYYQTATDVIDNETEAFKAKLPASIREEFGARVDSLAGAAKRDAYRTGQIQEDQFFKTNVENAATNAGNGMMSGQWSREEADRYYAERVNATNLPPEEKIKMIQSGAVYIAKLDYARSIKAEIAAGNVSAETLIRGFESFSANAYMDHKAATHAPDKFRAGYGSDFVVRADGSKEKVTANTVVSRADAERTLAYRLQNEFQPKVVDQVGSDHWSTLPGSARAALLSVAWNHGNLPDSVVSAVKTGDLNSIANAVESLPSNPERRQKEAAVIRGSVGAYQRAEFAKTPVEQDSRGRWFTPNIGYELDGKTRDLPLSRDYVQTVGGVLRAIDPRLGAIITSAAQEGAGPHHIGSHRHDVDPTGVGHTSDFVLTINGRKVTPKQAPDLYARAIEEFAAAGMTGVGHYSWGIHVGGGTPAFWGPSTTSSDADPQLQEAYNRGRNRAGAGIDGDPRFAMVPYEDRTALTKDAQTEFNAQQALARKQELAQNAKTLNDYLVGIREGKVGRADIETAIENGTFTQFKDMSKLDAALKKYQGGVDLANTYAGHLADPNYVFNPGSKDDRKGLNAVFGDSGKEAVSTLDQGTFTSQILPIVTRAQDIPTDLSGLLTGLARSADPKKVGFAMDALAQLESVAPEAYRSRIGDQLRKDVDFWNANKDRTDQAELVRQMNGGLTPQERSQREQTRKAGEKLLSEKNDYNIAPKDILESFDPGMFSSEPIFAGEGWMVNGAMNDYQNLFLSFYQESGNPDVAKDKALKYLHQQYGISEVGGIKQLIKYPPDKAGYQPIDGSYDWIAEDVHSTLGRLGKLGPTDSFALASDSQTIREVQALKHNPDAAMPSYMIVGLNSDGEYHLISDDKGQPLRMNFEPSAATVARSDARFNFTQAQEGAKRAVIEADAARQHSELTGTPIPSEILKNETDALRQLEEMRTQMGNIPEPAVAPADPMLDPNRTPLY